MENAALGNPFDISQFGEFSGENLDTGDWSQLIFRAIDMCRPYLPYLRMRSIKDFISPGSLPPDHYDTQYVDAAIIEPQGFDLEKRCALLIRETIKTEGEIRSTFEVYGVRYVEDRSFFLAQDGSIYILYSRWKRTPRYGLGYRAHRTGIETRAESCKFAVLQSAGDMMPLIRPASAHSQFLQRLALMFERGVSGATADQLQAIRNLHKLIRHAYFHTLPPLFSRMTRRQSMAVAN